MTPVPFDDLALTGISGTPQAAVTKAFRVGDSPPAAFAEAGAETFASLDVGVLDQAALISVHRHAASPGGAPPLGIVAIASDFFWGTEAAPSGAELAARVILQYDAFGGVADPTALRVLRRSDSGQAWQVLQSEVDLNTRTISAAMSGRIGEGRSEFTFGSTSAANTLQSTAPGLVNNPTPGDGSRGAESSPRLSWFPAPGAYSYDLYLWRAGDAVPTTPTVGGLRTTSFSTTGLNRGTDYQWRVVGRNQAGATSGPIWTFSTGTLPDLVVSSVHPAPTAQSGQPLTLSWIVQNTGGHSTGDLRWSDGIYLSPIPNTQFATPLGELQNTASLDSAQTYSSTATVRLPPGISGT